MNVIWKDIKNFSPTEKGFGGIDYANRIDSLLMEKMDHLRDYVDRKIIIHAGYAIKGHSPNSMHYIGRALDFHIEDLSVSEMFIAALRFRFTGIGVYPYWNNPGLHCDNRLKNAQQASSFWWRNKEKLYLPIHLLDFKSIVKRIEEG